MFPTLLKDVKIMENKMMKMCVNKVKRLWKNISMSLHLFFVLFLSACASNMDVSYDSSDEQKNKAIVISRVKLRESGIFSGFNENECAIQWIHEETKKIASQNTSTLSRWVPFANKPNSIKIMAVEPGTYVLSSITYSDSRRYALYRPKNQKFMFKAVKGDVVYIGDVIVDKTKNYGPILSNELHYEEVNKLVEEEYPELSCKLTQCPLINLSIDSKGGGKLLKK